MTMHCTDRLTRRTGAVWGVVAGLVLILAWAAAPCAAQDRSRPRGMFALYEQNREQSIPNCITEDFILLAHSRVLNQAVTELEEQRIRPLFQDLVAALLQRMERAQNPTPAARSNQAFLEVIQALLSGRALTGPAEAQKELELVLAAEGIAMSPLMAQRIDYSQFKVRGKYAASQELGRYFRAMKYAGTVLFPVLESGATRITKEAADRLTAQALELSQLLDKDQELKKLHHRLGKTLTLVFGPSEELTCRDYLSADDKNGQDLPGLRAALLAKARDQGRQPRIISIVVDRDRLEQGVSAQDAATGWRLLPQRYTPDSAAFQALVFDQVRDFTGQGRPFSLVTLNGQKVKGLPQGLELMALLGSKEAARILEQGGDTAYQGYPEAANQARELLYRSGQGDLASSNLRLMSYWLTRGQPSQADPRRRLTSCLGLWTWQRHISILYAKQSYTIGLKSMGLEKPRQGAWLTPAPELYLHLKDQLAGFNRVLRSQKLREMMSILDRCQEIASAELAGLGPSQEDAGFLNNLDRELKALAGGEDQPLVVDVHTEPANGLVLEEALGYPRITLQELKEGTKARGALFSFYEFKWPLENRLTDQAWQALLTDPAGMEKLELSPGSLPGG